MKASLVYWGALIGVQDLRGAIARQSFFEGSETGFDIQCFRHAPGEYPARIPIHIDGPIHKALGQQHIADVALSPHLIGPSHGEALEEIRG
jgi:hypothetical protein